MNIKEVELIVFSLKFNDESVLYMKFYKTGTVIRQGIGGAPAVNSSGIGFNKNSHYFDTLVSLIPGNLLERPLGHKDQIINDKVEYVIAFYGVSDNGFTEEEANWTKSTGLRFTLDSKSNTRNEVLSFVDGFTIKAVDLTNEWYFDIMMKGHFDMQSPLLTKNDVVTLPKSDKEKKADYQNYIEQTVSNNNGNWNVETYFKDKTYSDADGKNYSPRIDTSTGNFRILFFPEQLSGLQMHFPKEKKAKSKTAPQKSIERRKSQTSMIPEAKVEKKWWQFWNN